MDFRPLCLAAFVALATVAPAIGAPPKKPPEPNRVELVTSDSVKIAGFWLDRHDPKAPAALLLHNLGSDHNGFAPLWGPLLSTGLHVLALDLRGHGISRRTAPEQAERLAQRDPDVYRAMVQDAEAGLRFLALKGVRPERTIVIGGELGCSVGFALMARQPRLAGLVALSPGLHEYGFEPLELVKKYGRRPLLIVTSKGLVDRGPQAIADALAGKAPVQLEIYPGADIRGVEMLGQPARVEQVIHDWIVAVLSLPD